MVLTRQALTWAIEILLAQGDSGHHWLDTYLGRSAGQRDNAVQHNTLPGKRQ